MLVERDEELRALSRLASETAALGARAVALTGEAGAGKSRLAQDFLASLPEQWSTSTVRIVRPCAELPALASDRPLAVVVDDAHFLDPAAVDAVPGLLDRLGIEPVLLLLTFRLGFHRAGSAEMRALAGLVRDPRALELRVMPLSPGGIGEMAAAMGRYAGEELYRRTGGNPFWAEELLRVPDGVPWTVVEAVVARLDALPHEARELAYALAVAAEPLPAGTAGHVAADLDAAWRALLDSGLAEADWYGIGLRHALVGEVIETQLGPVKSAQWHGRVASLLEDDGADGDRVAHHWAAAGDLERAAAQARSVASELLSAGATRRAYACFELATRRPPEDPQAAAQLYEQAALTAARVGEQIAMRRWLDLADRGYRAAGQPDRAVRMVLDPSFDYQSVPRSERIQDEPVERLLLEVREAIRQRDQPAARALIDTAIDAARSRHDGMAVGRAARMLVLSLGDFERAEALLEEAAGYADVAAHPGRKSRILTIRGCTRVVQGHIQAGLDLMHRAVAISRQESEAVYRVGELALGDTLLLAGRVAQATETLARAAGSVPAAAAIVATADGIRRFEGDDLSGLDGVASGTDELLAELDSDPLGMAVIAAHLLGMRALVEVHGGRPSDALRTVARLDALAPEPFNDAAGDLAYVLARAGSALKDAGALAQGRRRIDELTRLASGSGVIGLAEAVRGFSACSDGRSDEAARHFQSAAELFERAPRAVLAAEAWCDAAQAAGRGAAATAALDRATRICEERELERVAGRIMAVRDQLAGEPAHLPVALLELTPREREVVVLAAEGLSNRQIGARLYLSEGTVRNYLSTAFAKLGVARRAELGRLVTAVASGAG